jgi:hypothetical protein
LGSKNTAPKVAAAMHSNVQKKSFIGVISVLAFCDDAFSLAS